MELAGCGFRDFRFQKLVTNFFGLTLVKTQFKNISPYNIVGIKYDKIDLKNKTTRQSQHAIYFTEYRENQIIAKDQQNRHYELKFDENLNFLKETDPNVIVPKIWKKFSKNVKIDEFMEMYTVSYGKIRKLFNKNISRKRYKN